jgi:hypothetical protein
MIEIVEAVRPRDSAARGFVDFPHQLYADSPHWVPPFTRGVRRIISGRHPFFDHSVGAFFTAFDGGDPVGRIAVFENDLFNEKHNLRAANFYFFDCVDSDDTACALFETAEQWARKRNLDHIIGPLFAPGSGGNGVLVEGFEYRAAMTMAPYNHRYYGRLIENRGYVKRKDYVSASIDGRSFRMPEKINRVAEITLKRGHFTVRRALSKRELARLAGAIGEMHNKTIGSFNETHNPTDREIETLKKELLAVADPALFKILTYDGKPAGFLLTYHDLSDALQRGKGRKTPAAILRLMREAGKSKDLVINGIGILPEYQRLGGNALLYKELERTVRENIEDAGEADIVQIAETTWAMMRDLENLGTKIRKRHRLYEKKI